MGLNPGPVRSRGAGHGSPLQDSSWGIPGTEEPVGYGPWGCREADTTERLRAHGEVEVESSSQMSFVLQTSLVL